jgi:hypothetical protein
MGKVNLMASSTLSDDDNCGHHVAFAPLSHGPSSSSSRAPSFWYSVAFAQSCRIVKCRHERPGSCGFHSLMTQADIRGG